MIIWNPEWKKYGIQYQEELSFHSDTTVFLNNSVLSEQDDELRVLERILLTYFIHFYEIWILCQSDTLWAQNERGNKYYYIHTCI